MSRLLIRVYGDSLSLPRASDGIGYFETYPELLRVAIENAAPGIRAAVSNRARGGMPASTLYEQFVQDSAYFGRDCPAIVVIQCGIVDCAPRPVPPSVKAAIGRLPKPLRWLSAKFLHLARPLLLSTGFSWRNSSEQQFEAVLARWLREATRVADRVYVINIAPTTTAIERHSPGLMASIQQFNAAMVRVASSIAEVTLVDVYSAIAQFENGAPYVNVTDGHHITLLGHRLYADMLFQREQQRAQ